MDDLWKKLYTLADSYYAMAPWLCLTEDELFGVQDPVTGEIGFLQMLGRGGEHFAISRYPGTQGLRTLRTLQETDPENPAAGSEIILHSSQMQLSWEDREELDKQDRKQIKELGLKYRGPSSWPLFRSYEPLLYPWYLTKEQGLVLLTTLEQGLQVLQRCQNTPEMLSRLPKNHYLVRVSSSTGDWQDEIMEVLPAVEKASIVSEIPSLPHLKTLAKGKSCVEMDLILGPPVKGENSDGRPYFPNLLLMADASNGIILPGIALLSPFPSPDAMYGQVAEKACAALKQVGMVPAEIRVRRKLLEKVLAPLADGLGLRVNLKKQLPAIEAAAQGLAQFF